MLTRPPACRGCPLDTLSTGFMKPTLAGPDGYKVALVGEALGEQEAEAGRPFVGRAGFKLTRLIEWAGLERSKFDIWNAVWCRPPENRLEGQEYEKGAIEHCKTHHWERFVERVRVVVPMGNVALAAFTGRKGILSARGYVRPGPGQAHLLPTVHPSFIQRGQSKYAAAFILDIQKAVELSEKGLFIEPTLYSIDPSPANALSWAIRWRESGRPRLAYDIETPGKDEDEGEQETEDDRSYFIWRIGFAYEPYQALSIPWEPPYLPAIRLLLETESEKVVWNVGFDNPRIRAAGVDIRGLVHDGMVAWHILHSDLPKGLGFVATFTCPWTSPWKHLSKEKPGFYNSKDADIECRSMGVIEDWLKREGLWGVYQSDVLELDPILRFMEAQGMPIDHEIRYDRAIKLEERQTNVLSRLESLTPLAARRWKPTEGYVREPKDTSKMVKVEVDAVVKRCGKCGVVGPTAIHFKETKKAPNPCAGAGRVQAVEQVERWARLEPFTPSREQIIRYNNGLNRATPRMRDKKSGELRPTTNEKALKTLIRKFPLDPFYQGVIESRELKKLQGTYIGYPHHE